MTEILPFLLLAAVARSAPRRLRRGTSYRYVHEINPVSDIEVAQIQKHQPTWKLMQRTGKSALFRSDAIAAEDSELVVPTPWMMIAGLDFVDQNDTIARWRVIDVRASEV